MLILTTRTKFKPNGVYLIFLAIIVFSQSRYKGFPTIVKVTPHTTETSIRAPLETRSPKALTEIEIRVAIIQ